MVRGYSNCTCGCDIVIWSQALVLYYLLKCAQKKKCRHSDFLLNEEMNRLMVPTLNF